MTDKPDPNTLQPCGHPLRFIVSSEDGTHYCLLCEYEARARELGYHVRKSPKSEHEFTITRNKGA